MRLFTYTNYCNETDRQCFRAAYPRLLEVARNFPHMQIVTNDILDADEAYELVVGVSPVRFMKHTPPILVTIQ